MTTRRSILKTTVGGLALAGSGLAGRMSWAGLPSGTLEASSLQTLSGKQPLIKRAWRPPNFESPLATFKQVITPNDQFFVRWHLAGIPTIDARAWRLNVGGEGAARELVFTLEQLKQEFEPVELVAVCQCAGNRRGFSEPHVPGVEWGNGAMGNARWKGVRLKDLLTRAGLKSETIEIAFNGEDGPPLPTTPDFVKSIPSWKAMDENTLVAYEMNGEPLPHWNGFPARLIVPGWVATYWMKQVSSIRALTQPLKDFWMASAYRIPNDKFPLVERFASQEAQSTTPITEMVVNSLVTNPIENQTVSVGRNLDVSGIAWDGGYGISRVEVSLDGARSWHAAELGTDLGRFSFRPWRFSFTPDARGPLTVIARASNSLGATQVDKLIFNKAGYHNNVLHKVSIEVT